MFPEEQPWSTMNILSARDFQFSAAQLIVKDKQVKGIQSLVCVQLYQN